MNIDFSKIPQETIDRIIKEEALKIRREIMEQRGSAKKSSNMISELKAERKRILDQLSEIEGVDEGILDKVLSPIHKMGASGRKDDFEKSLKTRVNTWVRKGVIEQPSEELLNSIRSQAAADHYDGSVGFDSATKQLKYNSSKVKAKGQGVAGAFSEGENLSELFGLKKKEKNKQKLEKVKSEIKFVNLGDLFLQPSTASSDEEVKKTLSSRVIQLKLKMPTFSELFPELFRENQGISKAWYDLNGKIIGGVVPSEWSGILMHNYGDPIDQEYAKQRLVDMISSKS